MFSWKGSLEKRKEKEQQDQLELRCAVDSFKEEYPKWYKECEGFVDSFLRDCGFSYSATCYLSQDKRILIMPVYSDDVNLSFVCGNEMVCVTVNTGVVTE